MQCAECSIEVNLSGQWRKIYRERGTQPLCHRCRRRRRERTPILVTDELRQWWLDRYTLDEIRELASPIWG